MPRATSDNSKPSKRGPNRKYATRKKLNEPAVDAGVWFRCEDDQYQACELSATREGIEWLNNWAMMHLYQVAENGTSRAYSFTPLKRPADHIQPGNRSGTGFWIPGHDVAAVFDACATREGFQATREWAICHLLAIATQGHTRIREHKAAAA